MKKIILILLLFITTISLSGCSKKVSETAYNDLITNLEKMDFNIIAEDVEEDILQGQRKWLKENIIVLYVGEDLEIINALEEVVGLQFARVYRINNLIE